MKFEKSAERVVKRLSSCKKNRKTQVIVVVQRGCFLGLEDLLMSNTSVEMLLSSLNKVVGTESKARGVRRV
jgi:hypothetical protein